MPSKSWRKSLSVIDRLLTNPKDFTFVQTVRLLERASVFRRRSKEQSIAQTQIKSQNSTSNAVARYSPPAKEVVRFEADHSLAFPGNEVGEIRLKDEDSDQWQLLLNFIGVTGAMGVMPYHYTELILERAKKRDRALAHFINLFNHRTASLFYQASNKYRLPIEYERTKLFKYNKNEDSQHTRALLSLLGLGTDHLRNRQYVRDESLVFYSGLLSQQAKTEVGLERLIEDYFGVPCNVEGFVGQWQDLIDDVRTRLPTRKNRKGQNACLGRSTMLGKKGWFAQGKSRIKIGPLNKDEFDTFGPSTGALTALNEMVHTYLGMEESFDYVIQVDRNQVPNKMALGTTEPAQLSWNAWLAGKTKNAQDDTLEIHISAKAL